jgi:hypothetical protein
MAAQSRPKNGVASLAFASAIHGLCSRQQDVDARHRAGHDVGAVKTTN